MLFSGVAFAYEIPQAAYAAKGIKKGAKGKKRLELFKKISGVAVTGQMCGEAAKKGIEIEKSKGGPPGIDIATVIVSVVFGYLLAMSQLVEED